MCRIYFWFKNYPKMIVNIMEGSIPLFYFIPKPYTVSGPFFLIFQTFTKLFSNCTSLIGVSSLVGHDKSGNVIMKENKLYWLCWFP
jgi:hypothetical protein